MVNRHRMGLFAFFLVTSLCVVSVQSMPPLFRFNNPAFGMMGDISQMVSNIGQMATNIAAKGSHLPGGLFLHTSDLRPGQQEVFNNGNTRAVRYRSADGTSSGYVFSSGSAGGTGFMASYGPNGQRFERYFF